MDFRNICSKIDMDAIKAKFPPLPDVLTQFKLPKSMSKLKSRSKIFGSSRDNMASASFKRSSKDDVTATPTLSIPPSDFVNHTPQRISTISSLVDQRAARSKPPAASIKRKNPPPPQPKDSFYRSAGGIEDYCPSPPSHIRETNTSPTEEEAGKMSFSERMQKSYKDVSDFRLKHIFVKKTVVRKDDIALNHYIEQYSEDRQRQERYEEKLDRKIADNYDFEFKLSRRKSEESFGISTPSDTPVNAGRNTNNKKLLSEHSEDESGMELSPPNRKQGIAATRFARVRKVPLRMSLDEDEDQQQQHQQPPQKPRSDDESELEMEEVEEKQPVTVKRQVREEPKAATKPASPSKPKSLRQRFSSLTRQMSGGGATSSPENQNSPKKRKAPLSKQESDDLDMVEELDNAQTRPVSPSQDKQQGKPFVNIKENFKRFQKSFKLSTTSLANPSAADSEAEDGNERPVKTSKTQQFAERLKRFRSVDNVDRQTDEEQDKTSESPLHKFTSKLQDWKKSMKKKAPTQNTEDEGAENTSPQKRDKPVDNLMKKLKSIRARRHASTDDPDEDEEGGNSYREGFRSRAKLQLEKGVAAASQMPQMTMEKIKETKKLFRKKRETKEEKDEEGGNKKTQKTSSSKNVSDESDLEEESDNSRKPKTKSKGATAKPIVPTRHYYSSDEEDNAEDEDEYDRRQQGLCTVTTNLESHGPKVLVPLARAAWTNKSIHSDSVDTPDDDDDMLPRVLLHQNNSDVFESTIIIAVTRPISRSHSPSPYITELPPDSPKVSSPETKADNWVPNRATDTGVPIKRDYSKDTIASNDSSKGHSRKHSMDSSSDDSWIKDIPRGISTAMGLNVLSEMDEPWKIQTGKRDEKLYKAKSIDIFEKSGARQGLKIFEDFDDELKNMPVMKIDKPELPKLKIVEIHAASNVDSFEQDSGDEIEDNADDDNSSRVTRILKQPQVEVKIVKESTPPVTRDEQVMLKSQLYGNSAESLMDHMEDKKKTEAKEESEEDEDSDDEDDNEEEEAGEEEEDDNEADDSEEDIHPPSAAPSPPPSTSPPPPPLPERQPSIRLSKLSYIPPVPQHAPPPPPPDEEPPSPPKTLPPALPQTRPPLPPNRPQPVVAPLPKVPDRTPSMSRVAKPLVKTSSLRLAYDEQVNPKDVGKVNKLISQFEPNGGGRRERPRLIPRRPYMSQSSGDYSEDEEEDEETTSEDNEAENSKNNNNHNLEREKSLDKTPTNKPNKPKMQKSFSINSEDIPTTPINNNNINKIEVIPEIIKKSSTKSHRPPAEPTTATRPAIIREQAPSPPYIPSISISTLSLQSDQNSNFSQASSEYGSPLTYPSSRIGSSNETTPLNSPKDTLLLSGGSRRSRRSMTRDDEKYFSFDSDEETSYYSIGSSKSSRYVVDL